MPQPPDGSAIAGVAMTHFGDEMTTATGACKDCSAARSRGAALDAARLAAGRTCVMSSRGNPLALLELPRS
jgi:hypothetical protein